MLLVLKQVKQAVWRPFSRKSVQGGHMPEGVTFELRLQRSQQMTHVRDRSMGRMEGQEVSGREYHQVQNTFWRGMACPPGQIRTWKLALEILILSFHPLLACQTPTPSSTQRKPFPMRPWGISTIPLSHPVAFRCFITGWLLAIRCPKEQRWRSRPTVVV